MRSMATRPVEPPVSEAAVSADILRTMPLGAEQPPVAVTLLLTALAQHDGLSYVHSLRVGRRAWQLSLALDGDEARAARAFLAGLLHDVGKINIPRAVLSKPGRLSPGEWEMMRAHSQEGAQLLSFAPELLPFAPIVAAHHERPDGQGYPQGLSLADIPADAFVIAVADTIEAMSSQRPYASPMPKEVIARTLLAGAGTCWESHIASLAAQALLQTPLQPSSIPATDRYVRMPLLMPAST